MALDTKKIYQETGVTFVLSGDLTSDVSQNLKEAALKLRADNQETPPLILDLKDVSYIDSAGLGALIYIHKAWHERGRPFLLLNLSPLATKFLATTGLLRVFQRVHSHEEIREAIAGHDKAF